MGAQVHVYQYGGTPEGLVTFLKATGSLSVTGRVTVFRAMRNTLFEPSKEIDA